MNSDLTRTFFDEMVSLREGVEALVVINEELIEGLLESEEIHIDGTFRAAPRSFRPLASLTFFPFGRVPLAKFTIHVISIIKEYLKMSQ